MARRLNPIKVTNPMGRIRKKTKVKEASIGTQPVEYSNYDFTDEYEVEKDAAFGGIPRALGAMVADPALRYGFKSALGAAAAGALFGATNKAVGAIGDAFANRKYKQALMQAIQYSPALQRYDLAMLESYMPMIIKASPTVAADPRLLANYLESMLDAEGHLNLSTFKELANIESTILGNYDMRHPYDRAMTTGFASGMAKEMGKNMQTLGGNTAYLFFKGHAGGPAGSPPVNP